MGVGDITPTPAPVSHTSQLDKAFPYFMSIGMSYEDYWYKEPELVLAYMQADRICRKRRNNEMYAQGLYFYAALNCSLSNAFAKEGAKPVEYPTEPFPIDKEEVREREIEKCKAAAKAFSALVFEKNRQRRKGMENG